MKKVKDTLIVVKNQDAQSDITAIAMKHDEDNDYNKFKVVAYPGL